jgi:hypothetical protein
LAISAANPQSLTGLAAIYTGQRKYAEAEPLLQRALTIYESADEILLVPILETYVALLRKTNRETEATEMEARLKEIQAKQAQRNQAK